MKPITFESPEPMIAWLNEESARRGISRGELLRHAVYLLQSVGESVVHRPAIGQPRASVRGATGQPLASHVFGASDCAAAIGWPSVGQAPETLARTRVEESLSLSSVSSPPTPPTQDKESSTTSTMRPTLDAASETTDEPALIDPAPPAPVAPPGSAAAQPSGTLFDLGAGQPPKPKKPRKPPGEPPAPWVFKADTPFGRTWTAFCDFLVECNEPRPSPSQNRESIFWARWNEINDPSLSPADLAKHREWVLREVVTGWKIDAIVNWPDRAQVGAHTWEVLLKSGLQVERIYATRQKWDRENLDPATLLSLEADKAAIGEREIRY